MEYLIFILNFHVIIILFIKSLHVFGRNGPPYVSYQHNLMFSVTIVELISCFCIGLYYYPDDDELDA